MNVVFQVALYLIALGILVVAFLLLYRREDKKQMMRFLYKLAIYITPLFIVVMLFLVDYRKMAPVLNGLMMQKSVAYEENNSDTCNHANMVVSFECSNHYMAAVIKKS